MSITIAVLSSDLEYITRMLSYMKGTPIYHTWRLQLYTTPERIVNLKELDTIDLILVEDHFRTYLNNRIEAGGEQVNDIGYVSKDITRPLISLVSEQRDLQENELYKFQSIASLLHQIVQCYEKHHNRASVIVQPTKVQKLAFCSTLEQAGKTTMALHVAITLANKGYSVFYCNMEHWNSAQDLLFASEQNQHNYQLQQYNQNQLQNQLQYNQYQPQQNQPPQQTSSSFSDLLYTMKSNPSFLSKKWLAEHASYVADYNLYTLHPFVHEEDRQRLTTQDALQLISTIANSTLYQFIIIDLPSGMNEWTIPIIEACDVHYLLMNSQKDWLRKHRFALQHVTQLDNKLWDRLAKQQWQVMTEHYRGQLAGVTERYDIQLPYVEAWHQSGISLMNATTYRAAIDHALKHYRTVGEQVG